MNGEGNAPNNNPANTEYVKHATHANINQKATLSNNPNTFLNINKLPHHNPDYTLLPFDFQYMIS